MVVVPLAKSNCQLINSRAFGGSEVLGDLSGLVGVPPPQPAASTEHTIQIRKQLHESRTVGRYRIVAGTQQALATVAGRSVYLSGHRGLDAMRPDMNEPKATESRPTANTSRLWSDGIDTSQKPPSRYRRSGDHGTEWGAVQHGELGSRLACRWTVPAMERAGRQQRDRRRERTSDQQSWRSPLWC